MLPVSPAKRTKHISQPASQPFLHISTINSHRSLTLERNLPNHSVVQTGTEISVHKHYKNGTDAGSDEYLAIDTTAGASNPVVIANSAAVADGYTTEGFNLYGMQITWLTSSRAMQSKFYVVETETTDVWELYWNADSATSDKGTDVILKAFGPPDLGNSEP